MTFSGLRAVFLDRDGILIRAIVRDGKPHPPDGLEAFEILDEARLACRFLKNAGFYLVCVTNQPDVARGLTSAAEVARLNELLLSALPLDGLRICMHDDTDGCNCRKPKPGLLQAAALDANIDLANSFMVGDRWRDIEAGRAAGCRTVFVDYNYTERRPDRPDFTTDSVANAARWIILQKPLDTER
jgi:D-glycero-D-manno-heptose 1,7-bisphosphate phosphatase